MRGRSAKDAAAYPEYRAAMEQIARVVGSVLGSPPPDIDDPGPRDLWNVLGVGRSFRGLGTRNGYRLLRWAPMPVADLTREWFESELLCASIAGPAVSGAMMGPRSAGSGLVLLLQEAHRLLAGGSFRARGGPGAMTVGMAIAAHDAGAEIRRGSTVERIIVKDDQVVGVVADGTEIPATVVVSAVDPKTTFLRLMDPEDLTPDFLMKIRNYRAQGNPRESESCADRAPSVPVRPYGRDRVPVRANPSWTDTRLHRARIRPREVWGDVRRPMARCDYSLDPRSRSGPARRARDVDLCSLHAVPACGTPTGRHPRTCFCNACSRRSSSLPPA